MTNPLLNAELADLKVFFDERRTKQISLQELHEGNASYGMAYLALWAVLEQFAKRLGPLAQRYELSAALKEWQDYLAGEMTTTPSKIGAAKFDLPSKESEKIPPLPPLQHILPAERATAFYGILTPKRKYRDARNELAHYGEEMSLKRYEDFKQQVLIAFSEIDTWLGRTNK